MLLGVFLWGASLSGAAQLILGSTPIVADVVAQVAGPALRVEALIPRGLDPHAFEPTPREVQRLVEATLIFLNGAGLEAGLAPYLSLPEVAPKLVDLSQGLPLLRLNEDEVDPHVWWDPQFVALWVVRIRDVLREFFPAQAEEFTERAHRYLRDLASLDEWILEEVEKVPPERRLLVTDHRVLGYFAARYGFTVVGALVESHETLAEPSPQDLAELERKIRAWGIPAILVSPAFNPALALRVAQDTGARVVIIPAENLADTGGYVEMVREAVRRIVEALGP